MKEIAWAIVLIFAFFSTAMGYDWSSNPGDGSESNPYQISTVEQLTLINNNDPNLFLLDKNFILTADIDLDPSLPEGRIFSTTIIAPDTSSVYGFQGTAFTGVFDGSDFIISNITINNNCCSRNYLGLFGIIGAGGEVKNLDIEEVSITGRDDCEYVGGLCGQNNGIIRDCHISCSVSGTVSSSYLGGLCGENYGIISNCNVTGTVSAGISSDFIGGLCGNNFPNGNITDCHVNVFVSGGDSSDSIGGLCGGNCREIFPSSNAFTNTTILNCYAEGSVTSGSYSSYVGGLCGYNAGLIRNCFVEGSVNSGYQSSNIGGLCGNNQSSSPLYSSIINNCYAESSVTCENRGDSVGGLNGQNRGNIINCFATGNVTGGEHCYYLGGLTGKNYIEILNCYSTGTVSFGEDSGIIGGLCGTNGGTIVNCFWDMDTSGLTTSDGGTGKSTADMQTRSTFTEGGWDLAGEQSNGTNEIWQISEGTYPLLSTLSNYEPVELSGEGTPEDPYLISDPNELGALYHYDESRHYRLVSDIDLSGITWCISPVLVLKGSFDGNDYSITNLTINIQGTNEDYIGLIGKISEGQVSNLGIENVSITGDYSSYVGGLCGRNYGGHITHCFTTGIIDGAGFVGGLCGQNIGDISFCYSEASVSGSIYVGGLCGIHQNYYTSDAIIRGPIINSYARGSVSCHGGIVGGLCGLCYSTIINCYATGSVSGDDGLVGGLCGEGSNIVAINSFWDMEASGMTTSAGGTGKSTLEMKTRSTFTHAGWDFECEIDNGSEDIWSMPIWSGQTDYPRLAWQEASSANITCPFGINLIDVSELSTHWLTDETDLDWEPNYDLHTDGIINWSDLLVLGENWLTGVESGLPIAHWTFDLDATDSLGTNHGILMNGAVITNEPGYYKAGTGALFLDGLDDYMEIAADPNLDVSRVTMSAWVKLSESADPCETMFILNRQMTQAGAYTIYVNEGTWRARVRLDGSESEDVLISSDTPVSFDWTHIAATYDGEKLRLYINGIPQSAVALAAGVIDRDNPGILTIGCHPAGTYFFHGLIDEAQVYPKALLPDEIAKLAGFAPALKGHWTFDSDASDSVGANHGVLMNGAAITHDPNQYKVGTGALSLDGLDDFVNIVADENLDVRVITMSAWVKLATMPGPGSNERMYILSGSSYVLYTIFHIWEAYVIREGYEKGAGADSNDQITTDWTHLAATYDGDVMKLYVNGSPQLIDIAPGAIDIDFIGLLAIGATSSGEYNFEGWIDDVRIYEGALSAEEIAALAQE